ncbi:hypothetical protein [Streptomyces roseolus]|uniref:hypothetical protein n=1 Tax=Streptomyces roseolus TaxID=67358 RepID=UPI0036541C7B
MVSGGGEDGLDIADDPSQRGPLSARTVQPGAWPGGGGLGGSGIEEQADQVAEAACELANAREEMLLQVFVHAGGAGALDAFAA